MSESRPDTRVFEPNLKIIERLGCKHSQWISQLSDTGKSAWDLAAYVFITLLIAHGLKLPSKYPNLCVITSRDNILQDILVIIQK